MWKRWFYIMNLIMIGSLTLLTSCKKEDRGLDMGQVLVHINLTGVKSNNEELNKPKILGRGLRTDLSQVIELPFDNNYSMVATLTPKSSENNINNLRASTVAPTSDLDLEPLEKNVHYRLVVYKNDNSYFKQREFIYGQEASNDTLLLNSGETYTFIAYSFGKTETIPEVSSAPLSSAILKNVSGNSKFMYFKKVFSLSVGSTNLNIVLKNMFSEVTVEIDASEEMGNITTINANFDQHYPTADISLLDGTISYNGNAGNTAISWMSLNQQVINSHPVNICNPGTNTANFTINQISLNGSKNKTDLPPLSGLKILPGVKYTLKLAFQATGVKVNNLIWARGNLAYVNGIYFNRSFPEETGFNYSNTDYWNYDSKEIPLVPAMNVADNARTPIIEYPINDPCKLVAGGKWRMPTLEDFTNLGAYKVNSTTGTNYFTAGQPNGNAAAAYVYFEGKHELTNLDERLKFYQSGRLYGQVINHVAYNAQYIPFVATYMASDAQEGITANLGWSVQMPAIYYTSVGNNVNTFLTQRTSDGFQFTRDDRVPIRCVKDL